MIKLLLWVRPFLLKPAIILLATGSTLALAQPSSVWVIPIETEITPATAQLVKTRIARASPDEVLALVFFIDTPGGRLDAAIEIKDAILQQVSVPTIAVVANAISAGALIAMSAEEVAMLPGSSIGASTAVNAFTGDDAGPKVNSFWASQFRSVAEARNRNADVAEAMVITSREIPGLSTNQELVTLSAPQAVEFDIADIQATTLRDALDEFGYGGVEVVRLEPSFAERLGTALGNPLIAAALLVIGIGGILIEIFSPGFGVPGAIGVLALIALGAGAFIATPAGIFDLVLILAGLLLIVLEVLVIPGFGVAGILGIAAIVLAIIRVFDEGQWIPVIGYASIFSLGLLFLLIWMLPNSRFVKVFGLPTRLSNAPGTDPEQARLVASYDYLRGQQGTALSDLRPAGVARIGDERVDVVSQGDYVASGSTIEVLRVEGNRVVVQAVD